MFKYSLPVAATALAAAAICGRAEAQEPTSPPPAAPAITAASDATPSAQKQSGFVLGVDLGTGPTQLGGLTSSPVLGLTLRGGLLGGYKFGRVMAHLGLEYVGADQLGGASNNYGSVMFWLGVTGALWRSSEGRVELIGSVRLGPGVSFVTGSGSSAPLALVGYELTPGIRYYLHPSVALQAQAGFGGQYSIQTRSGSNSSGVHSLVASLGMLLVL